MVLPELKINEEKCVHCGMCVKDCIVSCLELKNDTKVPQFVKGRENNCIKCQHCLAVCPTGALSIWGKNPDESFDLKEFSINSEDVLNLIKSRRSIRQYKPENLDKERMNKLKDMLKYAPTGVNFHNLHFSIVDDIEVMDDIRNRVNVKLVDFLANPLIKKSFPHIASMRDAIKNGHDIVFRGAPHIIVVSTNLKAHCIKEDPLIALSYFDLYAQSMGVGTLWCGFAYYCFKIFPELCEYIEVPDGYRVSYAMLFGVPDVKYSRSTQPEDYNITSVKGEWKKQSLADKAKRLFWNFSR